MVFGSRKRATSNPPRRTGVPTTPSNPATLAALQGATRAFVKPASNGLSSAAAAAALKANPTVPTQPGELQTKRMVRRGSNSSMASAPGNLAPRHSISRQNSNASMSERSFRAQSPDPNRHNSLSISNGLHKHAPPVPAIPKNLQESAFRRSMSIEPPQRNHRGVNVDRGLGSSIHSSPADRTMSLTGTDREEARLSINFSRPMSPPIPPVMSDSPSSHKGHSGWFTEPVTISRSPRNATHAVLPNSTATDYENAQQLIRNAAETPVTKKQYASATEGTHLAKGGMQAKPTGTAVQVQKPASPTTRSPATSQPVNTVADQPPVHLEGGVQRTTSVSPARSARFLDTSVETDGKKHQPPPRSLSPAKSALKRSATSPGRTASPAQRFSSTVSEASDVGSDDGRGSATKKKKNFRVSFDEGTVDHSAESPPVSPTRGGLQASRWSGQTAVEDDLDQIMKPRAALPSFGSIRGRPTREDDGVAEKVTETVNSSMTNSVSTLSEPQEASKDHNLANIIAQDFAKKTVVSEPLAPEVTSVEGQGYHSDSDMESVITDNGTTAERPPTPPRLKTATRSEASPDEDVTSPVVIAVQPPTPKVEQDEEDLFAVPGSWDDFEGGSSARSSAEQPRKAEPVEEKVVSSARSLPKREPVTEAEQEPEDTPRGYTQYDSPARGDPDVGLSILEEESESDGGSIYSDAEEDLSDGGGFASLDAIVESPVVSTPQKHLPRLSVDTSPSPLAVKASQLAEPVTEQSLPRTHTRSPSEDWDEAKQYWTGLSVEKRKEVERQEAMRAAQVIVTAPESAQLKPRTKKKTAQQTSPVLQDESSVRGISNTAVSAAPSRSNRQQPAPPAKPVLKPTMRTPQQDQPPSLQPKSSLRQSMRGPAPAPRSTPAPMRKSMRGEQPNKSNSVLRPGLGASKYSSGSDDNREHRSRTGIAIAPLKGVPPPRPRSTARISAQPRAMSMDDNDSDASESSFRRSRQKPGGGGMMTMRSTMRGAAQPASYAAPAPLQNRRPVSMMNQGRPSSMMGSMRRPTSPDNGPRSSRFSVRSMSPTGSVTGSMFGRSFRSGSVGPDAAPFRGEKERPSSKGSMFSFGSKKEKENKRIRPISSSSFAVPAPKASSQSRFRSRFADSSDDEDYDEPHSMPIPAFRSRYADSDDDEDVPPVPPMPKDLTPVRGIPRRRGQDDADSTDLEGEDSDREEPQTSATVTKGTQGSALISGSLRDSKHARIAPDVPEPSGAAREKKKRGFFGLGRKKPTTSSALATISLGRPSTPETREHTTQPVAASPRSPTSPTAASRGKLQRRNTPQRMTSDSWPLPMPPKITGDMPRPASSDGPLSNGLSVGKRPPLGERITSTGTTATAPMVRSDVTGHRVIVGRNGKKKRFQGLRRAFGMED